MPIIIRDGRQINNPRNDQVNKPNFEPTLQGGKISKINQCTTIEQYLGNHRTTDCRWFDFWNLITLPFQIHDVHWHIYNVVHSWNWSASWIEMKWNLNVFKWKKIQMNATWIKFDEISMFQMKANLKSEYVGIILDMFWNFILFVPPHHFGAFFLLSFRLIKCQVGN